MVLNISKKCSYFFYHLDQAVQEMKALETMRTTYPTQCNTPKDSNLQNFWNIWLRKYAIKGNNRSKQCYMSALKNKLLNAKLAFPIHITDYEIWMIHGTVQVKVDLCGTSHNVHYTLNCVNTMIQVPKQYDSKLYMWVLKNLLPYNIMHL